jgi:beta-galactosidase
MKRHLLLVAALFCLLTSQAQRQTIRLDRGWKFAMGHAADPSKDFGCGTEYFNYLTKANSIHNEGPYSPKFNDSAWQEVRLPHDWAATLPYSPQASHSHGYKTVGQKFPDSSVGWYRKTLHIPAEDLGKRLMLRFDGIFRDARLWFNGFYMGTEPSGYATQVYDVTEYANYGGDNVICVRADASLEEGWFYEGAGIYRDVWLEKSAAVSVAPFGSFVWTDLKEPYDQAVINVRTEVHNSSLEQQHFTLAYTLQDAEGNSVAQVEADGDALQGKQTKAEQATLKLDSPRLWSPDDPYLYKLLTYIKVKGVTVDTYVTTIGIRDVQFTADRGFLLNGEPLKLKGVNMHQDHAGVGAAMPEALMAWRIKRLKELGCNAYRSAHNPMTPALLDICDSLGMLVIDENRLCGVNTEHLRLLENMIRRDRNHPSVIIWSDGNEEWGMENTVQGRRVAEAMREYTRLLDPTRHSTIANAGGAEMIKGLDVVGFNYIMQNDVDNRKRQHPTWKIVGTEETTGCGTRGVYFNDPAKPGRMVSMNRDTTHHHTENVIERGWQFYAERPWAAGVFYWTGFDYRGEPNPLSYPATTSEFGILDYCGFAKDEAFYLQSWWTEQPVLHIFPHWNLAGHEGEEVELWAYSNCDEVELTVNGRKLGRQHTPKGGHLKWKATYQPGRVVATGYKDGKRIITQTIATTGAAYATRLSADRTILTADGRDLAVVTVEVTDAKGRRVPDACPTLTFTLQGEGHILGAGNGDPAYLGAEHPAVYPCHSFTIPAFNGLAQVLVQSGDSPSAITLTCSAEGMKNGTLTVRTKI